MAASLPNALKAANITPFVVRAAQVEKAKPIIAYWCNYWIVNQIISKGLHNSDAESMNFTMALVERLEQTKAEHVEDDTITDAAGPAYIEQFGLETFQRADNAVRANKASRQTADTFQAAATFLELLQIWGPLDPEIASKIKFAKYHALRIAKALKAGEDPNLSNPAPEPSPTQEHPLDPNDPEVLALNGPPSSQTHEKFRQASVEEVPDEHDRMEYQMTPRPATDQLPPTQPAPVVHPAASDDTEARDEASRQDGTGESYYRETATDNQHPVGRSESGRASSIGGGYFPSVPEGYAGKGTASSPYLADELRPPPVIDTPDPSSFPPDGNRLPDTVDNASPSAVQHQNPIAGLLPSQKIFQSSQPATGAPVAHFVPSAPTAVPPPRFVPRAPPSTAVKETDYITDEEAVMKAQKHARWAISALNFEDVKTAVTELRLALESLGA